VLHRQRDAEVGDERMTTLEENVLGLDVAVDDAERVGRTQRVGDFARNTQGVTEWQLAFPLESRPQRLTRHIRHDVVEQSRGRTAVQQRQNVRVLEPGGRPDLGEEAFRT
jgi:hypothetical protein